MPNESSGKDLQITCWSLLRQISPSWRNLRHKMSTSVKLFLFILLLLFLATICSPYLNSWPQDFSETSHVYSWVVCALQCKILLTSCLTLTFQGHKCVKSHFGPYLGSCWTNRHQILTQGSLGRGLSTNQKIS